MSIKKLLGISLISAAAIVAGQAVAQSSPHPTNSVDTVRSWCEHLAGELRSVNLERCLQRPWSVEVFSQGGVPIPYVYWGTHEDKTRGVMKEKPKAVSGRKVLVIGAIHGDEISAVSLVFRWLDFLERTKQDSFLRENAYMFLPLANPDGFLAHPRTRTNKAGIDVNRNFSTKDWSSDAKKYWQKRAYSDPRRFPGERAESEKETQFVAQAVNDFKPDLIISVHAPYKVVDHDGPIKFPEKSVETSPLPVRTLGAFPGSLGKYAGLERNIPVVTPELPSATQLPDQNAIERLFLFIMKSKY